YDAHVVAGDGDVGRTDFAVEHVERTQYDALGLLDARTRRSAQADANQAGVGFGEDLRSDSGNQQVENAERGHKVNQHERVAKLQCGIHVSVVETRTALRLATGVGEPHREDGH